VLFDNDSKPEDYRFLEENPAFTRQTGLSDADALGNRIKELHPEHDQDWFDTFGRIALTGEPERFTNEVKQLNRWYDVYAFRVGRPEENKVAVLFKDITEYKHLESQLRQNEERLRIAKTAARLGIHGYDIVSGSIQWDDRIRDEGKGFEPGILKETKAGFGLMAIRERASYIGRSLNIESAPGKGSCFTLSVPLHEPNKDTTTRRIFPLNPKAMPSKHLCKK